MPFGLGTITDAPRAASGHGELDRRVQVGAVSFDSLERLHGDLDEEVAGRPAQRSRVTGPAHPDPLPVRDAGRHVDVDARVVHRAAEAVTGLARGLDGLPASFAARAGAGAHELAEDALRDLLHLSCAATDLTGNGRRTRSGTVTVARLAGCAPRVETVTETPCTPPRA